MSEPIASTVADKVVDRIVGVLDRLVDIKMLILGLSFLMYLDIWLINENSDLNKITIDVAFGEIKTISLSNLVVFVVTYSFLMSAFFPAIRTIYTSIMANYFPSKCASRMQSTEERQLSVWSLGFIAFSIWGGFSGYFRHGSYRGLIVLLFNRMDGDGFVLGIFRMAIGFFFLFCLALAFERDE